MQSERLASDFVSGLERFGASPAIIADDGVRLTYIDLAAAADAFAKGLSPEQRLILIEGCNTVKAIIAYLGALRSGRAVLLHSEGVGPESPIPRTFRPDAVYSRLGGDWALTASGGSTTCHPDLAILLSTSGTTGATKLVRISRAALAANATSIAEFLELGPAERPITSLSISYSYGLSVLNSHLAVGAAVLLTERSVVDDAFWDFAVRESATSLAGVPHSYEMIERGRLLERAPASLRTFTQAGGWLAADTIARLAAEMARCGGRLFVMYGQTEATARIAYMPPRLLADHPGCIGTAIPGGTLLLRDEEGREIEGPHRAGELVYRGPNVMMGYAETPADLARGPELTELATGDLAERNDAGLFRIVGRRSRFVKPFGLRVALDEIERELNAQGIAAMVAGDDRLIAIAVLRDEAVPEDLAEVLAERYRLPRALFHVMTVERWPLLVTGKRDYRALFCQAQRHVASERPVQADIANVFALHLPGRTVKPDSSFTSLGGDSFNYVNLSIALEEALGHLPRGWEELTVAQLELLAVREDRRTAGDGNRTMVVNADIVLRSVAIAAVVANHAARGFISGGTAALIMLVGYNWARFQRRTLGEGDVSGLLHRLATNVLLPFYAILTAYSLYRREVDPWNLFFVSNWNPALRGLLEPMWFISAYVQATLVLAAVVALSPAIRRSIRETPWNGGIIAFAASVAFMLTLDVLQLSVPGRSLDQVLPLMTLGWCLAFADELRRKAVAIAACALLIAIEVAEYHLLPNQPGTWQNSYVAMAATLLLLLFFRRVVLPRAVARVLIAVAAATYTIYLTHEAVIWAMAQVVHRQLPGLEYAVVPLVVGVGLHWAVLRGARGWRLRYPIAEGATGPVVGPATAVLDQQMG